MSDCVCVGHMDYGPHDCQCGTQIKTVEWEYHPDYKAWLRASGKAG